MSRILVLDDDPSFRSLVTASLAGTGHEVVQASRASEAEREIALAAPDLLLVDGLLPDADGSRWLAGQRAAGLRLRVIFMSAFWKSPREERQLRAEVKPDAILRKPVSADVLRQTVRGVLGPDPSLERLAPEDEDELKLLCAAYAEELPGRLAAIDAALRKVAASPRDTVLLAEARRLVHDLAGTAGSFGFEEVGAAAADVEAMLLQRRDALSRGKSVGALAIARAIERLELGSARRARSA